MRIWKPISGPVLSTDPNGSRGAPMTEKRINGSEGPPSVSIAEAIAEDASIELTEFSLYETVDPDALDSLLGAEKSEAGGVRVAFSVRDNAVVVERTGGGVTVRVNE